MTTTSVLPPAPEAPATPPAPRHPGSRVVAILTIVLGSAVILATIIGAVFATLSVSLRHAETQSIDVAGVTEIDVEASATDLTVVFDDVDEATLRVIDAGGGGWVFDVDGDTLRVEAPRHVFGWFLGGNGRATLTLPASLEGTDASFALGAGSLEADGRFGDLDIDLAAGEVTVTGEARSLDVSVNAGSADLALADVGEAEFTVGAGDTTARLTGTAPREVSIDVSAGSLDLTVPDETYALASNVSAGGLDTHALQTDGSSPRSIAVELSAGDVTLRGSD
ncbi:MAG: DUF4097 family beta strand repeat-containing protein [Microbacterium sp.]|uniref:DUF4097 family beta strand repeat-containing protein n=1 Tax=Microbacterium sp. TaxID=51671 RepID=UPI002601816F|nr:DUF4097 family beta strand repeat-containing protein [Microbacterium sp.]MCX6503258.1 DUF4097 family beta strand repeat-containing protein [Microbacterium sp.]